MSKLNTLLQLSEAELAMSKQGIEEDSSRVRLFPCPFHPLSITLFPNISLPYPPLPHSYLISHIHSLLHPSFVSSNEPRHCAYNYPADVRSLTLRKQPTLPLHVESEPSTPNPPIPKPLPALLSWSEPNLFIAY